MAIRKFQVPKRVIQTRVEMDIDAPPEKVASLYGDVDRWSELYPATIAHAVVVKSGDNWKEVEVSHKIEGCVPNLLIYLSATCIGLEEHKHMFDAWFLNDFQSAGGGSKTRYVITSYIRSKGFFRLMMPFLTGYIHRQSRLQMTDYVLLPIKSAIEKRTNKS